SRGRHTRFSRDWSADVCSSDLRGQLAQQRLVDVLLEIARPDRLSILGEAAIGMPLKNHVTLEIVGDYHRAQQHGRTIDLLGHLDRTVVQAIHGNRLTDAARQRGAGQQQNSWKTQHLGHYLHNILAELIRPPASVVPFNQAADILSPFALDGEAPASGRVKSSSSLPVLPSE